MTRTAAQSRIFTNRRHSPTVAPPPTPNHPPSQSLVGILSAHRPAGCAHAGGPKHHAPETERAAARCGITSPLLTVAVQVHPRWGVPLSTARVLPRAHSSRCPQGSSDLPMSWQRRGGAHCSTRPGGTGNAGRAYRPRRRAEALGPHAHYSIA